MDTPKPIDTLVSTLRDDVVSGASELVRVAADILFRAAEGAHAESVAELRAALVHTSLRILDAQPAMASLVSLVTAVLRSLRGVEDVRAARMAAARAALGFADDAGRRAAEVARRTAALLPAEGEVLTLSSSSTVLQALLRAPPRGVIVLESRPVREGRDTARALAHAGVRVRFAVDAAVGTLVGESSMVLLGADSIGDRGLVNKIGSLAAVLSARQAGVPVVVAADSAKILPPGFPQPLTDDRPGEQVWQPPSGVRIWNRYFEAVPMEEPVRVVTEAGVLGPEGMRAHRQSLEAPEELAEWARHRSGEAPLRLPG